MAKCDSCGSTIIMGGVKQGDRRFCDKRCAQRAVLVEASQRIDPSEVASQVSRVHLGNCPKCGGPGPVDVSTAYKVWSALVVTQWSNSPEISCRSCGRKRQAASALFSLLAGWWGFPWGLILTPVQVTRNIIGMSRAYDPYRPSPQLEASVRFTFGARLLAQQRSQGGAMTP